MKRISLLLLLFFTTLPVFGQIASPAISYSSSASAVDPHGNLLIFDTIYTVTAVPLMGSTGSGSVTMPVFPVPTARTVTPSTRITVIPGGTGKPIVNTYLATFQIVGTGKWGLYAAANFYSTTNNQPGPRVLVAIDAGAAGNNLPSDFSALSTPLNQGDVKLNPSTGSGPDTIFNIEPEVISILGVLPPTTTMPVKVRTERTITFDGLHFAVLPDIVLPQ